MIGCREFAVRCRESRKVVSVRRLHAHGRRERSRFLSERQFAMGRSRCSATLTQHQRAAFLIAGGKGSGHMAGHMADGESGDMSTAMFPRFWTCLLAVGTSGSRTRSGPWRRLKAESLCVGRGQQVWDDTPLLFRWKREFASSWARDRFGRKTGSSRGLCADFRKASHGEECP